MADPLRVAVVYGSARPQRLGIRMARFVAGGFARRGHRADLVEPLAHPLPLLGLRYREYPEGKAPETLEKVHRVFDAADAFVAVTGEYNGAVPPALVNTLDHFLPEFARKPSSVCCYSISPFGGARAVAPLRALFATLGAPPVQAVLHAPRIAEAFAEDGTPLDPAMEERFDGFAAEVEWYARALRRARDGDSG